MVPRVRRSGVADPCAWLPYLSAYRCVTATWFETEPGVAFIKTAGGSPDDRLLAEIVVRNSYAVMGSSRLDTRSTDRLSFARSDLGRY
jgi:hypothetical protein